MAAAYASAQMHHKVIVVEPSVRIGGMTTGGLGFTDIGNKQVVKGLWLQFYRRLVRHYGTLEQWVFEPSAAKSVLDEYLNHKRIDTFVGYHLRGVEKDGTEIRSIRVAGGTDSLHRKVWGWSPCNRDNNLHSERYYKSLQVEYGTDK